MALIGAAIAAAVLRNTQSWPLTLTIIVLVGLVTAVLLQLVGGGYVSQLVATFNAFIDEMNRRSGAVGPRIAPLVTTQVSGLLGFGAVASTTAALLLARWWQAMLYNPGGFRGEFHQLRLPLPLAATLVAIGLGLSGLGSEFRFWALMCTVPFFVAGFALLHGLVGLKGWGRGALIA
ncbi:conserved hypothetical protein, partial [Ricinus communis]